MDRDALDRALEEAFGGGPAERRVVVRQAMDLADAGRYAETHDGQALTVERVVAELDQAPSGRRSDEARRAPRRSPPRGEGLADHWNWWMGALEVAHGGFERFAVRRWRAERE